MQVYVPLTGLFDNRHNQHETWQQLTSDGPLRSLIENTDQWERFVQPYEEASGTAAFMTYDPPTFQETPKPIS